MTYDDIERGLLAEIAKLRRILNIDPRARLDERIRERERLLLALPTLAAVLR